MEKTYSATESEFLTLIRTAVREELKVIAGLPGNTEKTNDLLDFDQAVEFIRRPKSTLYTLVRKQEIPHSKICRRLYFSKADLTEWIKTGKVKTIGEIHREADQILINKK